MSQDSVSIGWREWLALPELAIPAIKAKIDTGARTSSLHVDTLEARERGGRTWLYFSVSATGRRHAPRIDCVAPAIARRAVTDSGGHVTQRWFIRTPIELAGLRFEAEINLTDRRNMLFPMLLGRLALGHRFLIDPAASYRCGRPLRLKSAKPAS
ncbi:MAG: ATP-dependent zinc protease [Gammaproteobacteria bacterium]|nr:MAG: ATP-dependent zinc protease [Gammaproteobacteria bacterium]